MTSLSEQFFDFVNEREWIRKRKLADLLASERGEIPQGPPWTEDPILQTYKFTNVHRHHDRTSAILREEFYAPHFYDDPADILLNCAIFRYFGTYEFARAVGWSTTHDVDWEHIRLLAKLRLRQGERVFTGAYVITNGGIAAPKPDVVIDYYLKPLHDRIDKVIEASRGMYWEETADWMRSNLLGFGGTGFMTKEVLLDTTYTGFWDNIVEHPRDGTFSFPDDWNDWTPIGPGARRGAARVLDTWPGNPKAAVSETVARGVIDDLVTDQIFYYDHDDKLVPTDIQFQLCEFDKYERVRLGQGKPRSKYRGGTT